MIMRIKRRIYGIENELGVVMRYDDRTWGDVTPGCAQTLHKPKDTSVRSFIQPVRIWHTNGSCSYIDTGDHPEYASPECYFIKDAVLYAKAGEILMNRILCESSLDGARMMLIKNNLGCDVDGTATTSFGCHENYLMHGLDVNNPEMTKRFIPFLITRQIMDGAGWWESNGTYLFAQRSTCIEDQVGNSTTNNRPLITMRDTLNDTGPMRRLHLILGDANILDVACFLKIGTTSLVLSLIEAGRAPSIEYELPIKVMKRIARDPDVTIPQAELEYGGKKLSALDVQALYCEIARLELASAIFDSEEIRAEMYLVLDLWEQALHALFRRDEQWMIGRFDYATKRYFAERAIKQRQLSSPSDMQSLRKNIDLMYHNITDRTLQNRMNIQWADKRMLSDKQIEKAVYFPPRNTRAGMRGLFVASILDMPMRVRSDIDWTYCKDAELPEGHHTAFIKDPFETRTADFIEFLLKSVALPHDKTFVHYSPCDD